MSEHVQHDYCIIFHHIGAEELHRLTKAGACLITHFGNGMPPKIPRHNNVIQVGFLEDKLSVSLITDGRHIPDEFIRLVFKIKGMDRVMVISDVTPAAGKILRLTRIFKFYVNFKMLSL